MQESLEISPHEASALLGAESSAVLIDVREPEEFALAKVPQSRLIPMASVPAHLQTLEGLADAGELLVLCHHGVRSLQVVNWLRAQGVENCRSVAGGIESWSREVDASVPRY